MTKDSNSGNTVERGVEKKNNDHRQLIEIKYAKIPLTNSEKRDHFVRKEIINVLDIPDHKKVTIVDTIFLFLK